jgi:sirohydrochlorin ferrochelatase
VIRLAFAAGRKLARGRQDVPSLASELPTTRAPETKMEDPVYSPAESGVSLKRDAPRADTCAVMIESCLLFEAAPRGSGIATGRVRRIAAGVIRTLDEAARARSSGTGGNPHVIPVALARAAA